MQIRATIRSFPKYTDAIWMKGKEQIDINQPKYKGSLKHVDYSVLCINSLKKEDQSEYLIEITNAFGTKTCRSNLLKVIGGNYRQLCFIFPFRKTYQFSTLHICYVNYTICLINVEFEKIFFVVMLTKILKSNIILSLKRPLIFCFR